MQYPNDDEAREIARTIEEKLPDWFVVWGVYTKQFVAFPLFGVPRGTILTAYYPDALVDRMQSTERRLRISAEKRGL